MARYKHYDYGQMKMLLVSFERQILPGTFEDTLNRLIDEDFDLSIFEARYKNDETGAPAYDPAILLKIILLAYARGVTSSRQIAALCQENVVFMALSADRAPHFTTIADFVSSLEAEIVSMFRDVAEDLSHAICPAGKRLYRNGRHCDIGGFETVKFTGAKRDCSACEQRPRCLRNPQHTPCGRWRSFSGEFAASPRPTVRR